MSKTLPIQPLGQRDARWRNQRLGTKDSTTIGSDGCVITSASMMYTWYGKTTLPNQLDDFLTNNNLYFNSNLWIPGNVGRWYTPMSAGARYYYSNIPADITKIKAEIDADRPCFVWVINGVVYHCTLAVGYEEVDGKVQIIVNDPWMGDQVRIDKRWGDSAVAIQEVNCYNSTVKPVGVVPMVQVPSPDFERLVTKSSAFDAVNMTLAGKDLTKDEAVTMIKELREKVTNLQYRIDNIESEYIGGYSIKYYISELGQKQDQAARLKEEVTQLHKTIDELTILVESGKGASKSIAELQSLVTSYKTQLDEYAQKSGKNENTIAQLESDIKMREQQIQNLTHKVEELSATQSSQIDQHREESIADILMILYHKLMRMFDQFK